MDAITRSVSFARERFPNRLNSRFHRMFEEHGIEVRGKHLVVDFARYLQTEEQGRLGWFVAP